MKTPFSFVKTLLPGSLFGRALLILVVPTVLVQLLTAYIFFERHWDNVTRHMSSSLAGEIALLVHEIPDTPSPRKKELLLLSQKLMDITVSFSEVSEGWNPAAAQGAFPDFVRELKSRLAYPFYVEASNDDASIMVHIRRDDMVMHMQLSIKRLASPTTTIFILWMAGSALVLLVVATIFLRNQIRPISRLAEAAENFGKGLEMDEFRPSGAREVRQAGRAFLEMRERIRRQVSTRMDMLAGVSHDLRTPLTRMKLQLAMLKPGQEIEGLNADVAEMERMIQEYLDFTRGVGQEEPGPVRLALFLNKLLDNYRRQGAIISLEMDRDSQINLRPHAMTRCLNNIIDNALRYGAECRVIARVTPRSAYLHIDDKGPGIPPEKREEVFRPFTRLDPSRNVKTGGVGLGLTIARDIVHSHGGEITCMDVPESFAPHGLRVTIRLPC